MGVWDSNPSCVGWSWCSHQASKLLDPVIMAVVVGCIGGVGLVVDGPNVVMPCESEWKHTAG